MMPHLIAHHVACQLMSGAIPSSHISAIPLAPISFCQQLLVRFFVRRLFWRPVFWQPALAFVEGCSKSVVSSSKFTFHISARILTILLHVYIYKTDLQCTKRLQETHVESTCLIHSSVRHRNRHEETGCSSYKNFENKFW
jgi:hypothetical protein